MVATTNFTKMLDSNLLYALFDLTLNVRDNQTSFESLYYKVINKYIPSQLDGLTLDESDQLFIFSDASYDGTLISKVALSELVNGLGELDLSTGLNLNLISNLIGEQEEVQDGFDRLFGSQIIISIISNATRSENIKAFGARSVNRLQTYVTLNHNDLKLPANVYDANQLLYTNDLKDLFIAAYILINEVGFSNLDISKTQTLEQVVSYKGRNKSNLDYLLDADIIYLTLDQLIQSSGFRTSVANLVEEQLKTSLNVTIDIKASDLNAPASAKDSNGVILKMNSEV